MRVGIPIVFERDSSGCSSWFHGTRFMVVGYICSTRYGFSPTALVLSPSGSCWLPLKQKCHWSALDGILLAWSLLRCVGFPAWKDCSLLFSFDSLHSAFQYHKSYFFRVSSQTDRWDRLSFPSANQPLLKGLQSPAQGLL